MVSGRALCVPVCGGLTVAGRGTVSATTPFAPISSKRRRPSAHCPLRVHALIATAYVTELRGTPATSMYVKSVIALSSCITSAHALIAPVYVTVFRSTPDASGGGSPSNCQSTDDSKASSTERPCTLMARTSSR